MAQTILVSEIFGPTIQGEGALAGRPTIFVRTGGCDFRCTWCDSMHAVDPKFKLHWQPLTSTEILDHVNQLAGRKPVLLTLSGGNPALQPLAGLIDLAHAYGHQVAMETQGSVPKPWFRQLDHLILSPKPPSSGQAFDGDRLNACINAARQVNPIDHLRDHASLKVVVMDERDYDFARMIWLCFARPHRIPFFITPGNAGAAEQQSSANTPFDVADVLKRTRWLVEKMASDHWHDVTIIPQLHTLLWGNELGR